MSGLADVGGFKLSIQVCVAGLPTPVYVQAPIATLKGACLEGNYCSSWKTPH